jgi:hypothetical protein
MDAETAINNIKAAIEKENQGKSKIQLIAGNGISVFSDGNQHTISLLDNTQDPISSGQPLPLDIQFNGAFVFLRPGIVAGFLPDNIFTGIPYAGGDLYVWASCTAVSGVITAVTLNYGSTTPTPQTINLATPPSSLKIPVGMIKGGTGERFNFIGANWLTPYPALAYSTQDLTGNIQNYYVWRW